MSREEALNWRGHALQESGKNPTGAPKRHRPMSPCFSSKYRFMLGVGGHVDVMIHPLEQEDIGAWIPACAGMTVGGLQHVFQHRC